MDHAVYLLATGVHGPILSAEAISMFRMAGYIPLWIIVAAALALVDAPNASAGRPRTASATRLPRWGSRMRVPWNRAGLLLTSVLAGGASAELLKMVIRRERPAAHAGHYAFRAWSIRPMETDALGLPSSHAAVAFSAARVLSVFYPRAAPVWLFVAIGCAFTRVLDNSHFLSDVVAGGILGLALGWLMRRNWTLETRN